MENEIIAHNKICPNPYYIHLYDNVLVCGTCGDIIQTIICNKQIAEKAIKET